MAEASTADLLMVVKPKGASTALIGEAQVAVDTSDPLMDGFEGAPPSPQYGVLEEFSIGARVEDRDMSSSSGAEGEGGEDSDKDNDLHGAEAPQRSLVSGGIATNSLVLQDAPSLAPGGSKHLKFRRFIEGIAVWDQTNGFGYGVDLDEVTLSRKMDCMSPQLLQLCGEQTEIDEIILVRRKPTTSTAAKTMQPYLRLKFSEVLLTGIEWEDGDVIKEKIKFVYRTIEVKYKRQKDDGTLAGAIGMTWEYPIDNV
jgi:type VI protein secretion system component Hcp